MASMMDGEPRYAFEEEVEDGYDFQAQAFVDEAAGVMLVRGSLIKRTGEGSEMAHHWRYVRDVLGNTDEETHDSAAELMYGLLYKAKRIAERLNG